ILDPWCFGLQQRGQRWRFRWQDQEQHLRLLSRCTPSGIQADSLAYKCRRHASNRWNERGATFGSQNRSSPLLRVSCQSQSAESVLNRNRTRYIPCVGVDQLHCHSAIWMPSETPPQTQSFQLDHSLPGEPQASDDTSQCPNNPLSLELSAKCVERLRLPSRVKFEWVYTNHLFPQHFQNPAGTARGRPATCASFATR